MSSARSSRVTVVALSLALLLGAVPLAAEAGGPVLEYLQGTIKPLLDAIALRVVGLNGKVDDVAETVGETGRVKTVAFVMNTVEGAPTIRNIDLAAGIAGDWSKIRRYTVSVQWGALAGAPAGLDLVIVNDCVANDDASSCRQLTIDSSDPHGAFGVTAGPYAGVNSFVRIERGADGLGPVDVYVNAYIEMEH